MLKSEANVKTFLLLAIIASTISCETPPRTSKGNSVDQEYPNPFSPPVIPQIEYQVPGPDSTRVVVVMYYVTGELVDTLLNEYRLPGEYKFQISGSLYHSLASGVYFYKVAMNGSSATKKCVLLK